MKKYKKILLTALFIPLGLIVFNSFQSKTVNEGNIRNSMNTISTLPQIMQADTSKMLKESALIDFIAQAKTVRPNPKNGIPFGKMDYDKVIAYNFAGSEEPYPNVINGRGKFVPVVLKQQYLTQEQADKILATLANNSTYGGATAACFQPHFALVFYKNNKKINQISICLDCNYLTTEIEIPAVIHKKMNLGKIDEYPMMGFSKSGKKAIINLCKQLNFYYGM